ncbi:MAG: DUF1844 domain-containing protein [Edaphobacter sp.]|uniref:DUF1844 domain-containing protein n=1 Tax=Edaphobacter sp. TaxID=1934404 RepID=UPI00239F4EFD|nr:DUF1844 domain-containing protein [Edaphobacter sp.]MDE1177828.1 DUF1844 domain-containing protein [Edaphobacter sp.]
MSEQNKPFVITDRRKFTMEGEARPDADPSPEPEERPEAKAEAAPAPVDFPAPVAEDAESELTDADLGNEAEMIPGPTAEQAERAKAAYDATSERLDTAIRAANPGADHPPAMSFTTLIQSVYMSAIVQLGGATPEGQAPQVDIIGARQSIDMLAVIAEKTQGNLANDEQKLLDSALFELRMGFLEITQALARSASAKAPTGPGTPGKPSIVR